MSGSDVPGQDDYVQWVERPINGQTSGMIEHWKSLKNPIMVFRPVGYTLGPYGREDGPLEFFVGEENDAKSFKKIENPEQIFLQKSGEQKSLYSMGDLRFVEPLQRLCIEHYNKPVEERGKEIRQCAELLNKFQFEDTQIRDLVLATEKSSIGDLSDEEKSVFFASVLHQLQELQDQQ